jgi:hypothetical protein
VGNKKRCEEGREERKGDGEVLKMAFFKEIPIRKNRLRGVVSNYVSNRWKSEEGSL